MALPIGIRRALVAPGVLDLLSKKLPMVAPICLAYRLRAKLSVGPPKRRVRRIVDFATPPKRNAHFCMKMYKKSQGQHHPLTLRIKNKGGGQNHVFSSCGALGASWAFFGRLLASPNRLRVSLRTTLAAKCRQRWFGRASGHDFSQILEPEDMKKYGFS